MSASLNILMAQINPALGNITYNLDKIINIIQTYQASHDIIVFPELALTGYQLEDLLLREELYQQIDLALKTLQQACNSNCHVIVGHPKKINNQIFNQASIFTNNICKYTYNKQKLPNYGIFDEKRYYTSSTNNLPKFMLKEYMIKVCICEDLWQHDPVNLIGHEKTDVLISINSSPFEYDKSIVRTKLCQKYAKLGANIIYVNQVGGQDELVFDGASFAMNQAGQICAQAPAFLESIETIVINHKNNIKGAITKPLRQIASVYQAIVLGLKDYVHKNNFQNVLLGLSGGIDSAPCLALAVDALGAAKVQAVLLPSQYTAEISKIDANEMINKLGIRAQTIAINDTVATMQKTLADSNSHTLKDLTLQNLQARIRGAFLMTLSNDTGAMLICTSNKSETAVGYSTLYGDMNGGYAPLKDVFKTMVYDLARYRNQISEIIPERIITRAPSAELTFNQKDEDTLPKYGTLDIILKLYIEENQSIDQIISQGYDREIVHNIMSLLNRSEYKRKQSVMGPKISKCAFGRDWRMAVCSQFYCAMQTVDSTEKHHSKL